MSFKDKLMESLIKYDKSMSSIELTNKWMFEMDKAGVDPVIAYAALGDGFVRMSYVLGFPKEDFINACKLIADMQYKEKRQREEEPSA